MPEALTILAIFFHVGMGILVLLTCCRQQRVQGQPYTVTHCAACKYNLEGLSETAPCPECGTTTPRIAHHPSRIVVSWKSGPTAGVPLIGAFLLCGILPFSMLWTTLNTFHEGPRAPLAFGRLENEPFCGVIEGAVLPILVYLCLIGTRRYRRHWLVLAIICGTGMLIGEQAGLTLGWLDAPRWHAHVEHWCALGTACAGCLALLVAITSLKLFRPEVV